MTRVRRWTYLLFPPMCFLLFAYPISRLAYWYSPETSFSGGAIVLLWLFATFAMWYSFSAPRMVLRYVMVHWMGLSFILLVLLIPYEVIRLIVVLHDRAAIPWILGITAGVVLAAIGASHLINVKSIELRSRKITRPYRIVQITDVHVGSRRGSYLARVVRRIQSLHPNVVVITGDLLDSSAVDYEQLNSLHALDVRTLFCIGNHERYANLDKALTLLQHLGVEVLRQQQVTIGELRFIGIDDADDPMQVAKQLPSIPSNDGYTVLLYHRPHGWEAAREYGVDLMLCGHTHNGQIFPFNLLVKHYFKHIHGLYQNGDAHLYVSPGTGTWGPLMRLGSLNEITCIDLKPLQAD